MDTKQSDRSELNKTYESPCHTCRRWVTFPVLRRSRTWRNWRDRNPNNNPKWTPNDNFFNIRFTTNIHFNKNRIETANTRFEDRTIVVARTAKHRTLHQSHLIKRTSTNSITTKTPPTSHQTSSTRWERAHRNVKSKVLLKTSHSSQYQPEGLVRSQVNTNIRSRWCRCVFNVNRVSNENIWRLLRRMQTIIVSQKKNWLFG